MLPPNQETKLFFETNFSNYKHLMDHVDPLLDIANTKVPAIKIEGLDKTILSNIYHYCSEVIESEFTRVGTYLLCNNWYNQEQSQGWYEYPLKTSTQRVLNHHSDKPSFKDGPPILVNDNLELTHLCTQLFGKHWSSIKRLKINKLVPGGWIMPHQDRLHNTIEESKGLGYFIIPLHPSKFEFKFFPAGYLRHRYGNMYMLTVWNYLHSVQNTDLTDRYMLAGEFESTGIPEFVQDAYKKTGKDWQKLFQDELTY
jgi:hypothetical protein